MCMAAKIIWTNCQYRFEKRPHVKAGEILLISFKENVLRVHIFYRCI